jgi:hypothetical protein
LNSLYNNDGLITHRICQLILVFIGWIASHPILGIFARILVYIAASVLFVPGSILTIGTGYAFHSATGSVIQAVAMAVLVQSAIFGLLSASLVVYCTFTYSLHQFLPFFVYRFRVFSLAPVEVPFACS